MEHSHLSQLQPATLQIAASSQPSIARGIAKFIVALNQHEDATGGVYLAETKQFTAISDMATNLSSTLAKIQGTFRANA